MNILFAIPWLDKSYGGVYQYSLSLFEELKNLEHNFFVAWKNTYDEVIELSNKNSNIHIISSDQIGRTILNNLRFYSSEVINHSLNISGRPSIFHRDYLFDKIIKRYKIDIIHSPTQAYYGVKGKPSITTIHDVQELHYPEFFNSEERRQRAINYKKAIDHSQAIIVSYNHVKKDIVKFFNKPEKEVHVCSLSMKNLWFENLVNGTSDSREEGNEKYVLYPAATWPHKNHLKLLEAIKILKDNKQLSIKLICTGYKTEHFKNISNKINSLGLNDNVEFKGFVSENELLELYQKARAVVIPTLYEAGSFPLIESIILGVPVISSNVTSLPETMGNQTFLFDPNDALDISRKLNLITCSQEFRRDNVGHLSKQKAKIQNKLIKEEIDKVYQNLVR